MNNEARSQTIAANGRYPGNLCRNAAQEAFERRVTAHALYFESKSAGQRADEFVFKPAGLFSRAGLNRLLGWKRICASAGIIRGD
jgi:hypothetical protein